MKMFVLLLSVGILGTSKGINPCISASGLEWERYNGHWYHYSNQTLNWMGAQMYCRRQGGNLAHIDDAQENDWLSSKYTEESIWIGVDSQAGDGVWRSITTGEKAPYINWSAGNPDNAAANQHCVSLNWGGIGRWDDNQCWKEFTFICEVVGYGEDLQTCYNICTQ